MKKYLTENSNFFRLPNTTRHEIMKKLNKPIKIYRQKNKKFKNLRLILHDLNNK